MTQNAPEARVVSIVDDDEAVQNSITDLLKSAGCKYEVFRSAEAFFWTHTRARQGSDLTNDLGLYRRAPPLETSRG